MIFRWICGVECSLPVLFLCHLSSSEAFLVRDGWGVRERETLGALVPVRGPGSHKQRGWIMTECCHRCSSSIWLYLAYAPWPRKISWWFGQAMNPLACKAWADQGLLNGCVFHLCLPWDSGQPGVIERQVHWLKMARGSSLAQAPGVWPETESMGER